ncbi:putative retinal pigment epithelial membrane protein [Erysiphe necator]|uniref:Putative retinal pigment epithelial membrane protein n=1 Tax=Uncinula necator TaxID=52586 RepID=A0A0B1PA71_UNCNE|nr:putative retinal pigment epithelial membrane protein [Erysiphe necator]
MTPTSDRREPHPYLVGNFAPIHESPCLTRCDFTGNIPPELAGGQYVRNGGNPLVNSDLGREAHWFDGDGMLSGVVFHRAEDGSVVPEFVSRYILTDSYLMSVTLPSLRHPIIPSMATLVNPASTLLHILGSVFRTLLFVLFSHLSGSLQPMKRISVANTNILYHDGRALATCESGPPLRVLLPRLETVGWFDGYKVEGEPATETKVGEPFGVSVGNFNILTERITAHPREDPITKELILFHSTFFAPFVYYSIIPSMHIKTNNIKPRSLINTPIPGIKSAKMMHDMGLSRRSCVIMDLPLSLDPLNIVQNKPIISYNPSEPSRFGVFPRWEPEAVRWFETSPCCIFHTANTWDDLSLVSETLELSNNVTAVNMLVCRLTSASLVYNAGNIATPALETKKASVYPVEEEQCRLYYYRFLLSETQNIITHQFALSAIPFEFPTIPQNLSMSQARYIYGCTLSNSTFGTALGGAAKIDCLAKIDSVMLLDSARVSPPTPIIGCVDNRSVAEIIKSNNKNDSIKIFKLPPGCFAQEPRFVPRNEGKSEDDGWLLSYVFDESQINPDGFARPDAKSELWIIDAITMEKIGCKVKLPQRVPYGLHGSWFNEHEILNQRPVDKTRRVSYVGPQKNYNKFNRKVIFKKILTFLQ